MFIFGNHVDKLANLISTLKRFMTLKHNLTKLMKANTARNDYQNMIFFVGLASCGSPASRYATPGKKNSLHCWY